MNNKAQFTPLKKAVHVIPMLYAEAFAGSNNKEFVVELYEDARLLETAAPAMYEALTDAERMWNIARMIDSKHHAGNPISNDLWSDFHRYLMEWHAKRKAALTQAEGKHD